MSTKAVLKVLAEWMIRIPLGLLELIQIKRLRICLKVWIIKKSIANPWFSGEVAVIFLDKMEEYEMILPWLGHFFYVLRNAVYHKS